MMRALVAGGKTCHESVQDGMAGAGMDRVIPRQSNLPGLAKAAARQMVEEVRAPQEYPAVTAQGLRNGVTPVEVHEATVVAGIADFDDACNADSRMRAATRFEVEMLSAQGRASVLPMSVARKCRTSALLWVAQ